MKALDPVGLSQSQIDYVLSKMYNNNMNDLKCAFILSIFPETIKNNEIKKTPDKHSIEYDNDENYDNAKEGINKEEIEDEKEQNLHENNVIKGNEANVSKERVKKEYKSPDDNIVENDKNSKSIDYVEDNFSDNNKEKVEINKEEQNDNIVDIDYTSPKFNETNSKIPKDSDNSNSDIEENLEIVDKHSHKMEDEQNNKLDEAAESFKPNKENKSMEENNNKKEVSKNEYEDELEASENEPQPAKYEDPNNKKESQQNINKNEIDNMDIDEEENMANKSIEKEKNKNNENMHEEVKQKEISKNIEVNDDKLSEEGKDLSSPNSKSPEKKLEDSIKKSLEGIRNSHRESENMKNSKEFNMNEDQMIELAQSLFGKIAEKMKENNISTRDLFINVVKNENVDGEIEEIITSEDFIKAIKSLNISNIEESQFPSLIAILSINDDHEIIKLADIVQILTDFGVTEGGVKASKKIGLDLKSLDSISMIIMLAMTEYLVKNNVPLYDLLGDKLYQQKIKSKEKQANVELINSDDLFGILKGIGIGIDDPDPENLKKFLCLDKKYPDKISIKKLKTAINEFATNEELRLTAQAKYKELAEKQEDELDDVLGDGLNEKIQAENNKESEEKEDEAKDLIEGEDLEYEKEDDQDVNI